jgi:hypothetical protein
MRGHSNPYLFVLIAAVSGLAFVFRSFYEDALKARLVKELVSWVGPIGADVVSGLTELAFSLTLAIIIVWGLHAYMAREFLGMKLDTFNRKKLKLANLRSEGVAIRNDSLRLEVAGGNFDDLRQDMLRWEGNVLATIGSIDLADAESFHILDEVPPPNITLALPRSGNEGAHLKIHREHDFRIKKLATLIERYASRSA